ncbi:MAG: adenylate/guanylate cyclase domain-containing protein, partial [Verrucomicrobia bacterium]|nr:adenylate/guanylate cyclase domain-containing protein [Verrucomicrobiota bacterium]
GGDGGEFADVTVAGSMASVGAQKVQSAAILVCDIRGFSSSSEILPADQLAMLLGQWFREAGNLVQKSGGIIDKFIGDAILAYWQENPGPPRECVSGFETARKMLGLAARMAWPAPVVKPFKVGIALHYGRVTFGNIGLVAQRDATIIGDAVNTAFRLEGIMKELGQDLLLSDKIAEALADHPSAASFNDLGEKTLKGKREAVRVFGMPIGA